MYDGSIRINTKIDTKGADEGVENIKNNVGKLGGALRKITPLMITAFAIKTIMNFLKASEQVYKKNVMYQMQYMTVLQKRLNADKEMIKTTNAIIDAQAELGIISKDQMQAGAAQLGMYVSTAKVLEQMIPTMNDIAAFQFGFDATAENLEAVGKALGQVVKTGDAAALNKLGITFSEAEKNALKYATEAERANIITKAIEKSIGGMNAELAKTDLGRQKQFANTWEDTQAVFGEVITQLKVSLLPILYKVNDVLKWLATQLKSVIGLFASAFGSKAQAPVEELTETQDNLTEAQNNLTDAVEETNSAMEAGLTSFDQFNKMSSKSADSTDDISTGFGTIESVDMGAGADEAAKSWGKWGTIIEKIINALKKAYDTVRMVYEIIVTRIMKMYQENKEWIDSIVNAIIWFVGALIDAIAQIYSWIAAAVEWLDQMGILEVLLWAIAIVIGVIVVSMYIVPIIIAAIIVAIVWLIDNWDVAVEWIKKGIQAVGDWFVWLWGEIVNIWNAIVDFFVGVWDSIIRGFVVAWSAVADFFVGIWDNVVDGFVIAWTSIKDFVGGIFEWVKNAATNIVASIGNGLIGIINMFIRGINVLINGLNKIQFDVPDWIPFIGGKKFGFNIKPINEIPRLAKGAVIPPNNEFMAILGDQKSGINIESPLSTIVDAFKKAIAEMGGMSGGQFEADVNIDGIKAGTILFKPLRKIAKDRGGWR